MLYVSHVIKGQFYEGNNRNYRKITISLLFSYNSFVKYHGKKFRSIITRRVKKVLH